MKENFLKVSLDVKMMKIHENFTKCRKKLPKTSINLINQNIVKMVEKSRKSAKIL